MTQSLLYLDSSALVKLVVSEPETPALLELMGAWPERVSSVIARVEVIRALRRAGVRPEAFVRAEQALERTVLVEVNEAILKAAADLPSPALRSLDAIHLSTALFLGNDCGALVTYDSRLTEAATEAGVTVLAPR